MTINPQCDDLASFQTGAATLHGSLDRASPRHSLPRGARLVRRWHRAADGRLIGTWRLTGASDPGTGR